MWLFPVICCLLPSSVLLLLVELDVFLQFWSACMKSLNDQRMLLSKLSTLFAKTCVELLVCLLPCEADDVVRLQLHQRVTGRPNPC